jgi:hybrid cluster-associated redox disulfide protein
LRDAGTVNPAGLLNMLVSDVLAARPVLARAFIERRMGCVGCAFAPFETVAEAARAYGLDSWEFATSLATMANTSEETRP